MKEMRKVLVLLGILMLCSLLVGPYDAHADLVLKGGSVTNSFTDLDAQGFGNDPRLLTLQNNDTEAGQIIINSSGVPAAASYMGLNNVASPGPTSDKNSAPSLFALGWNSGAQVSIGLNLDEVGGVHSVTLSNLVLNLYNSSGATVDSFALATPVLFDQAALALQQGNGNAVFDFVLDPAQQSAFNTFLIGKDPGNLFVGLAAKLTGSTDGPDSFIGIPGPGVSVPEPATVLLLGSALVGVGVARKRIKK